LGLGYSLAALDGLVGVLFFVGGTFFSFLVFYNTALLTVFAFDYDLVSRAGGAFLFCDDDADIY